MLRVTSMFHTMLKYLCPHPSVSTLRSETKPGPSLFPRPMAGPGPSKELVNVTKRMGEDMQTPEALKEAHTHRRRPTPTVFPLSSMAFTKLQASFVQDLTVSVRPSRNKRVMVDS